MLKVFHFSNKPPFPLKDGGCVAISGILRSLLSSKNTAVFHFTLKTSKHGFRIGAYPKEWVDKMGIDSAYVKTRTTGIGAIIHLLKNKSYNVARFYSEEVEEKVKQLLEEMEFDLVVMESIYLLPYLHLFKEKGIKVVVRAHNVEHQIWSSLSQNSSFLKKWYLKKLATQLKEYEESELKKVDGIIAISSEDQKFFKQFEPKVKTTTIPVPARTKFPKPNYELNDFYFLGAMNWKPNIEGINWLLKDVIPNGPEGDTTFYIAGRNLKMKAPPSPKIKLIGEVENAVDFMEGHGICLIPLLSGSGVKIKLIENMGMGKPIITTTEGIRGVDVTHEKEVLVADTPEDFRAMMVRLHSDYKLRKRLGENAKQFIIDNYSFINLTYDLLEFLRKI